MPFPIQKVVTRVQNRLRQFGNEPQHERWLCGQAAGLSHTGGQANLFLAEIEESHVPRPLGGEGGPQPAPSPAGAGRVRGSKTLGPTEINARGFRSHFCILRFDLFLRLRHDACVLVKTPSPPRQAERGAPSALRSPLSPKGARENESLVWRRIRKSARAEPCLPHGTFAKLGSSNDLSPAARARGRWCLFDGPCPYETRALDLL